MRVDFSQSIKNLQGAPLTLNGEPLTIGFAVITALLNTFPGEPELSGEEKARRYWLARAVHAGQGEIDASTAALIRELVGKTFGPPVVGPVFEAFALAALEPSREYLDQPLPEVVLEQAIEETMAARAEAGLDELPKKGTA